MDHRRYLSPVGMLKSFIHDKFSLIISTFNKAFKIFNVPTTQHYKKTGTGFDLSAKRNSNL